MHDWSLALKGSGTEAQESQKDLRRQGLDRLSPTLLQSIIHASQAPLTDLEVRDAYAQHLNASLLRLHKFAGAAQTEKSAAGLWVEDSSGRRYLDCTGGYGVFSLGHRHPEVLQAVSQQLHALPLSSKVMLSEPLARLAKVIAMLSPPGLSHLFMCNSGTEAIEGALKLALAATGRHRVLAMEGAFHGKTLGSISLCGRTRYRQPLAAPLLPCEWVRMGDEVGLRRALMEPTAAIIIEPLQGESGIHLPPAGWLRTLRKLCDLHGTYLIFDEVQCGLGRTGKMFACEWDQVTPDLICLGKAFGGGVVPAAGILGNEKSFAPLLADPFFHTSTFGGNPLACVAALATLRILVRDDLAENALKRGEELRQGLQGLAKKHSGLIADVRGRGLMLGVEFHEAGCVGWVIPSLRKKGILVAPTLNENKVIRLEPPLTLGEDEARLILQGFTETLEEINREFF